MDICQASPVTHMVKKSGPKRFRLFILNEKNRKKMKVRITFKPELPAVIIFEVLVEK